MGGNRYEELKPAAAMVAVQVALAVLTILYKLAINDGMNVSVMVAYRYLFATASMAPLAFFHERNSRPKMTWKILIQAFFCGLFGAALVQNLYTVSIKLTSATFSAAMTNLIPVITFGLAVIFKLEILLIQRISGKAKVAGTLVAVGGAMLLTFYKGPEINLWSTSINLLKPAHSGGSSTAADGSHQESSNPVLGALFSVASCFSYAIWLILQAKMNMDYPCLYTSTTLVCFMGSMQSVIFALCTEREWDQWRMGFDIRLLAVSYTGVVGAGLVITLLTWCMKKKGPLYVSVFNPLMPVLVALLGSLILNDKLHLGSILGAVLIIIGLYLVLWGKGREVAMVVKVAELPADKSIDMVVVSATTTSPELILGSGDDDLESRH